MQGSLFVANYSLLRRTCAEERGDPAQTLSSSIRWIGGQAFQPHGFVEPTPGGHRLGQCRASQRVQPHVGAALQLQPSRPGTS